MKRLKLTAALLVLGMLTGCQLRRDRENQQMEAINNAEEKAVVTLRNTAAPERNFNDAVASVNEQLWGTWEVKNDADRVLGGFELLIFTPQGQGFISSSQSNMALTFRYNLNSSYQPMHMDFVGSEGDRRMTIFEFMADGQLRLEFASLNPGNRPSDFTSGGVLFTKISNTVNLLPNTEFIDFITQLNKAVQVEARSYIGAMNRAQQGHHLEHDKFATNIQELNRLGGIKPETENYRYRITKGDSGVVAINTARAKYFGPKSYTGVVWVSPRNGENITYARLCQTTEPSMSAPSITISRQTNGGLEYECGDDSHALGE